jgi:hypothetical protein|tara:strand:- start:161 stop:439 length:279 start_codon:yes stop_codon:yes gene_type:complete
MNNERKTKGFDMKHELVHETINIKGWDIVGSINWKIGEKTELEDPNKTFHFIHGSDKAGTLCQCIGEVVDGQLYNVLFEYLIAKTTVAPLEN